MNTDEAREVAASLIGVGLAFRAKEHSVAPLSSPPLHAPVTLKPTPFPRTAYELALRLQPPFNELVFNCVRECQLLKQVCYELSAADDFVARLFGIWKATNFAAPEIFFNISRSDYMLDEPSGKLFQVELNTISASLAGLSTRLAVWHRQRLGLLSIPENRNVDVLAGAFHEAVNLYASTYNSQSSSELAILWVVQPEERNYFDQQHLIDAINLPGQIRRVQLNALASLCLCPESKALSFEGSEVALVYYRAGYAPDDYFDESCWQARLTIEQSRAIKCPDIAAHLAGLKKMQQVLTDPVALERVMPDPEKAQLLQSCFTGIYALEEDNLQAQTAMASAIQNPQRFVLKPQREGGGNNIYNEAVAEALQRMSAQERAAYILMDRIQPKPNATTVIRNGAIIHDILTVSELGIYGAYLRTSSDATPRLNSASGWLLRTKPVESDEGGVVAGFSVIDSISLT